MSSHWSLRLLSVIPAVWNIVTLSGATSLPGSVSSPTTTMPLEISVLGVNVRVTIWLLDGPPGNSVSHTATETVRGEEGELNEFATRRIVEVPANRAWRPASWLTTGYCLPSGGSVTFAVDTNGVRVGGESGPGRCAISGENADPSGCSNCRDSGAWLVPSTPCNVYSDPRMDAAAWVVTGCAVRSSRNRSV